MSVKKEMSLQEALHRDRADGRYLLSCRPRFNQDTHPLDRVEHVGRKLLQRPHPIHGVPLECLGQQALKSCVVGGGDVSYVGIIRRKLGDGIHHEATHRARFLPYPGSHIVKDRLDSVQRPVGLMQRLTDAAQHPVTVGLQRVQKQCPLIAKCIVQATAAQLQDFGQILNRGRRVPLAPEQPHRLVEGLVAVKSFRAGYFVPFIPELWILY
jgi:hypothetical protein